MSCISSSPSFSPSSDKRFWSALRSRIDTLLENRKPFDDPSLPTQSNSGECNGAKRTRNDSLLLLRGFDSVGYSLSQLSQNLDSALQGARDLARPPTITEIYQSATEKTKSIKEEDEGEGKRGLKRKSEASVEGDDSQKENEKCPKEKLKKAKNLAISMTTKATALARELKSIKSDLGFLQERCALLEDENTRLRDGFSKGIRPEEDDLVRLQLEALLAEKSRLAHENANLTWENQRLHQLEEYHQLTSQDLSEFYEDVTRDLCLDFSSPPPPIPEDGNEVLNEVPKKPRPDNFRLCTSLDEYYDVQKNEEPC